MHLALFLVWYDKGDQQIQKIFISTAQCYHPSAKHLFCS